MATRRQQKLSPSSSSRLASARLATARLAASKNVHAARVSSSGPAPFVRWGSAVVESVQGRVTEDFVGGNGRRRRERHSARRMQSQLRAIRPEQPKVVAAPVAAAAIQSQVAKTGGCTGRSAGVQGGGTSAAPATSFTQNRIRHAFELFGACMMIVTFLAMAMFA